MKKFMFVSMMFFVFFMAACASQPSAGSNGGSVAAVQPSEDQQPFLDTDTTQIPCFEADAGTDFFSCTQIVLAPTARVGDAISFARKHAKEDCAGKVFDSIQGITESYRNDYGNNQGDDLASKMEEGFRHAVEAKLANIKDACLLASKTKDNQGRGTIYLQIKFSKKDLAEAMTDEVSNMVPDEEKKRLDFQAYQLQKKIEDKFGAYKKRTAKEEAEYVKENEKVYQGQE